MTVAHERQRIEAEGRKRREAAEHADNQKHASGIRQMQATGCQQPGGQSDQKRSEHIHSDNADWKRGAQKPLMDGVIERMTGDRSQPA
jgi:hypothetical protein